MTYRVKLVRGEGDKKETCYAEVEAAGATLAYIAAMKTHNASELWSPVAWEELGEKPSGGQA